MSKKYALRLIHYPHDNHYITTETDSVYIVEYFDSKSEAEKELKLRIVNAYYNYSKTESFGEFDVFDGYASDEVIEKASKFYMKKTGKGANEFVDLYDFLYLELSDDEIIEFIMLLGINEYDVIEIDADETFYAVWINQAEKYFGQDGLGSPVIPFDNDYLKFDGDILLEHFACALTDGCPKGELSHLSDTPDALVSAIGEIDYVDYDNKSIDISLNDYSSCDYENMKDLIQLNTLLKKPWFEIRALTISELQQLNDEAKEKNKTILLAHDLFLKARIILDTKHNNDDELYHEQLKAIDFYQQGIDYAKQALLTTEEPNDVKDIISNALYRLECTKTDIKNYKN